MAMPAVFNSLRLLFGLAFGYIMLAEVVKFGSEAGGLGDIIRQSQRRGLTAHIWLILFIIPVVAIIIDQMLLWTQRSLFPYRYGGSGFLRQAMQTPLDYLEGLLGDGRPLLLGERVAIADCTMQASLQFVRYVEADVFGERPLLRAWDERYRARPAAQSVLRW